MAFIEPMHHNKPNITYLLKRSVTRGDNLSLLEVYSPFDSLQHIKWQSIQSCLV